MTCIEWKFEIPSTLFAKPFCPLLKENNKLLEDALECFRYGHTNEDKPLKLWEDFPQFSHAPHSFEFQLLVVFKEKVLRNWRALLFQNFISSKLLYWKQEIGVFVRYLAQ